MATALAVLGIDPDSTIHANFALIVPVRIAELLAWERWIQDPAQVTELHQMRIAAKRLRYTLELGAPFYGAKMAAAIREVKALQDLLGTIHDADVLIPQLRDHLRDDLQGSAASGSRCADFDAAEGLLAAIRSKVCERDATYSEFVVSWRKHRESGFFESLRDLVRRAAQGNQETTGKGGRDGRHRGKRNGPVDRKTARDRPDSGAVSPESRVGQHSLFEEGDGS